MIEPGAMKAAGAGEPRWPRVVGTIGIVLGVLMVVDKLDDLLLPLLWPAESWSKLLAPEVAEFVLEAMPPPAWLALSSLVGLALGVLLWIGSLRLRRRRRSGIKLCRTWSWLAILWIVLSMGVSLLWIVRYSHRLTDIAPTGWQGPAVFGILVSLALLLVYPVFLLVWLARPDVREEFQGWAD